MNSGKVLLVNLSLSGLSTTPFYVMPPGLLSVAAYLRENGVAADFLDLNVIKRKRSASADSEAVSIFRSMLAEGHPCLVGASVMVAGQFKLAREVLKSTKGLSAKTVTVVGGAHVSQFPEKILENCPEIDFVVIGEGEPQALACSRFAESGVAPASWPDGLAYRSNGRIVVNPKKSYMPNVDALPFPAYDLVDFEEYRHDTSTWHNPYQVEFGVRVPIITSRGCPNLCNFCSVARCMGLPYRPMSPARVADMIQMLHERHNARTFAIFDANFAEDSRRVIEICNEIARRNLKITIDLPTGLPMNAAAKEIIEALAGVGLIRTCISIESGDSTIRNKVMKKHIDQTEIFDVVEAIRRHPQIFLLTDFVLGMPEDTVASLEASCELIDGLDVDDLALSIATPYPGTALFRQCEQNHLFSDDIDTETLWESQWFTHANTNRFVIKPYELDTETLFAYRDRILAAREPKIASYRKRMKEIFNVESNYGGTLKTASNQGSMPSACRDGLRIARPAEIASRSA